jgi:hypothetical protein
MVPLLEKTYDKAKSFLAEGVPTPKIRVAEMGNDAGNVGAAMMAPLPRRRPARLRLCQIAAASPCFWI